ncbi:sperm acrosome associated 6 [Osmerus eperlanus]|uniref:sperm acrosome associated 6 n=1 Tax=Osmerus eperlanus TaxID=29151 RepID=UPI002E0D89D9
MWKSILWLLHAGLLLDPSIGCYHCLVDMDISVKLCWGHVITESYTRNMDECFEKVDRLMTNATKVIEAGRVGPGYDQQLREIMLSQIIPLLEEFDQKLNDDTVYEKRLQTVADNFIAAASKLPRASGCIPPCGFQAKGALYNCITCKYDTCELPLDCPVEEITVVENNRTRMWCDVSFPLPIDLEVIWRFAEEVKSQQVDLFKEVTAGVDRLYSIPSANLQHTGTYQCEILSNQRSIVRLYFYLTVKPQVVVGYTDLQEIFDLSLLPGGRIVSSPGGPPPALQLLPQPALLTACLTTLLLLLFLSLGILYWKSAQRYRRDGQQAQEDQVSRQMYVLH